MYMFESLVQQTLVKAIEAHSNTQDNYKALTVESSFQETAFFRRLVSTQCKDPTKKSIGLDMMRSGD